MKNAVENGFTLYEYKHDNKLVGTALRSLKNGHGLEPVYMEQENLNVIDVFPFLHLLEEGKTMQKNDRLYDSPK